MKKIVGFFLGLLFLGANLLAQDQFPRVLPAEEGVSSKAIIEFLDAIEQSEHEMHSLMILKNGNVVAEGWWDPYSADLRQTMYSVSKSFTATAIGFAVQEKLLDVDDTVVSFFPGHSGESLESYLQELRIRDLLTMTVGHEKDMTFQVVGSENWVEEFFKLPVSLPPGTNFVYNTIATYMLSAIVQKLTQETLLEYLTPRLFEPLEIIEADWETDPSGINVGGYGLRIKTEDMAKFGQLMLQRGQWQGQQLLPIRWVVDASSAHIFQEPLAPKEKRDISDWHQGYGYQMWRSRFQSFRADGAFGQYILVLPELESVVVITSETSDMQSLLNLVWDHLLPGLDGEEVSPDKDQSLKQRLDRLYLSPYVGIANTSLEEKIKDINYELNPNGKGISSIKVSFENEQLFLTLLVEGEEPHLLTFGKGVWLNGETRRKGPNLVGKARGAQDGLAPFQVAGSYGWKDESSLVAKLNYLESPHTETIEVNFKDNSIELKIHSKVNAEDSKQTINGKKVPDVAQAHCH
ncbi:serine hydrolase [Pleomorphovibrio marinus]|uniref:serine hydrolase n=1 Tax=Pleomorphovibrio marinus TaxID=2164132 RepID=UPI000E0B78A9|nr:serine hydrolase [Pleomorphovibrio marinus]